MRINQVITKSDPQLETFRQDVIRGLQDNPKKLSSKYLYDARGDVLFQKIMHCEDYYPTRCESNILKAHARKLAEHLTEGGGKLELIELGVGDATKTRLILEELIELDCDFTYMPIDISTSIIERLHEELPKEFPGLKVEGIQGDYLEMLDILNERSRNKKALLFLGGNIGNMTPAEAKHYLKQVRGVIRKQDQMLIGFDLVKSPETILTAYSDSEGLTRAFNLNLLRRINCELDANFVLDEFEHFANYDPVTGACKSYLVSKCDQTVSICGLPIHFKKHEPIWTEISQKYRTEDITDLAERSGFKIVRHFMDNRRWFTDTLLQA